MALPRRPLKYIETPAVKRDECARCRRPTSVCYCAALTTIDTVTRVVILQHPREKDMPIGTARMATLCLPGATMHVGVRWDGTPALRDAVSDPARPPILLYPGPGARDILTDPPTGPVTLIVVDGTWSQAKVIVRENPGLASLPRYAFRTPEPTHYRIRREPREEYVSTIEALMHVLGALEGNAERFRAMLEPMHKMIDAHLTKQGGQHVARVRHPRFHGQRAPGLEMIAERWNDLVCVAGEANAWPASAFPDGARDELLHWVARRVATGETFDVVARPDGELAPRTSVHTELDADRIMAGVPRAELLARFAAWSRPTDVICSWGGHSPELYEARARGALPQERLDLRAVARRLTHRKVGTIDAFAESVSPAADAPPMDLPDGRAGRRLGMLVRIVSAWRGREADA
ncbi:MAG: DTW domain-containing protein [Planctomycetes bacterium]|nr:DTW domain-containing protein [Planctomycetota bacterium]